VGGLHVLHEGLSAEEHLVAHGAAGGVGSTEQGRVLLQYRITQLKFLLAPEQRASTRHQAGRERATEKMFGVRFSDGNKSRFLQKDLIMQIRILLLCIIYNRE
jgi:hypothetical protein